MAAVALKRLVLDITPEILVQSRWVRLVHLVDAVGVFDSGERCGDDDYNVVVGGFMGKVRVCTMLLVSSSQTMCIYAATYAGA